MQKSRAITKKVQMQDLWFLFSARRLIFLNISWSIRLVQSIKLDFIFSWKQVTLKYLSYGIFKESEEN